MIEHNEKWEVEENKTLTTREIFLLIAKNEISGNKLCWNSENDKKLISDRFQLIAHYGILKALGSGACGEVYLALDIKSELSGKGRLVAIKIPSSRVLFNQAKKFKKIPHLSDKENEKRANVWAHNCFAQFFSEEAVLTARMSSCPYVVSVLHNDIFSPFIVLEYCEGGSLKERIQNKYEIKNVLSWGYQMASALSIAHNLQPDGLVHRDLKPENIMISQEILKIADWGTSKMLENNKTVMINGGYSPSYGAPEAFGGKASLASDIWSFGIILYELISGHLPFSGKDTSMQHLNYNIAVKDHVSLKRLKDLKIDASLSLMNFIDKCLSKKTQKRPTAKQCLQLFARLSEAESKDNKSDLINLKIEELQKKIITLKENAKKYEIELGKKQLEIKTLTVEIKQLKRNCQKQDALSSENNNSKKLALSDGFYWETNKSGYDWIVSEKDGQQLAYVPAGEFWIGRTYKGDETSLEKINIPSYMIGRYPVTNQQYRIFLEEEGHKNELYWQKGGFKEFGKKVPYYWDDQKFNDPKQPVVGISWYEAQAYINWAKLTLPTELQWTKAARGGIYLDEQDQKQTKNLLPQRTFPWGNEMPNAEKKWRANYKKKPEYGNKKTSLVGNFPLGNSPYGCLDMAGNVWEWCEDCCDENYWKTVPKMNQNLCNNDKYRVVFGGSWFGDEFNLSISSRYSLAPTYRGMSCGFRTSGVIATSLESENNEEKQIS